MPRLTPVRDATGAITDVEVSYPLDLATQMLEYSDRYGMADEDRRVLASLDRPEDAGLGRRPCGFAVAL